MNYDFRMWEYLFCSDCFRWWHSNAVVSTFYWIENNYIAFSIHLFVSQNKMIKFNVVNYRSFPFVYFRFDYRVCWRSIHVCKQKALWCQRRLPKKQKSYGNEMSRSHARWVSVCATNTIRQNIIEMILIFHSHLAVVHWRMISPTSSIPRYRNAVHCVRQHVVWNVLMPRARNRVPPNWTSRVSSPALPTRIIMVRPRRFSPTIRWVWPAVWCVRPVICASVAATCRPAKRVQSTLVACSTMPRMCSSKWAFIRWCHAISHISSIPARKLLCSAPDRHRCRVPRFWDASATRISPSTKNATIWAVWARQRSRSTVCPSMWWISRLIWWKIWVCASKSAELCRRMTSPYRWAADIHIPVFVNFGVMRYTVNSNMIRMTYRDCSKVVWMRSSLALDCQSHRLIRFSRDSQPTKVSIHRKISCHK